MMPAGFDAEFKRLFAQEAEQRLESLSRHLLELEDSPNDAELVATVFRDAHNLKGSAAVVGVDDVARVAHAMEDLLEQLRSKAREATPEVIDALLAATDGLAVMVPALLTGDDQGAPADELERRLRAAAGRRPADDRPAAPAEAAAERPESRPPDREADTLIVPVSRLDELVRLVGESASASLRLGRLLTERWDADPESLSEYRDLSRILNDLQERTMRARMVPVATITESLHRAVRDLSRALGKKVRWEVRGGDTELDRNVLQRLSDPLLHLVRNAVDHGIEAPAGRVAAGKAEQATLLLEAVQLGSEVIINVTDDGRGIDVGAVRARAAERGVDVSGMDDDESLYLVFDSGLSTARAVSEVSGRGVGLDVVRAGVEGVHGRIEVSSDPGKGTHFRIVVPITLAVLSCLLVEADGERYALPMHSVVVAQAASPGPGARAEGRPMVWAGDAPLPVSGLASTLWGDGRGDRGVVVVVVGSTRRHAFLVDRLVGQRDVVVKGLSPLLPRLDLLAGTSVEPDGSIVLVLDAAGLVERASARRAPPADGRDRLAPPSVEVPTPRLASVLVVDDAAVVRQLERSILERAGYDVRTASDGNDALSQLAVAPSDLVITDIEMPGMDGFALTEAIRSTPNLTNTPVLILSSRASEESRRRGLEAGADGYIVKAGFDETALLEAVSRLLGHRL